VLRRSAGHNLLYVRPAGYHKLGSVLKNGLAIADVATTLKPEHFYDPRYRGVYAAMFCPVLPRRHDRHCTLAEELARQGTYDRIGGLLFLSEIDLATPSAAHIVHCARIVVEHATRRRYIGAAQRITELAWDVGRDLEVVRQHSEALILGAASDTVGRKVAFGPEEWTANLMDFLGQSRAGGLAGVSTGLRDLDAMMLGLSKGWLYLLGARTGTGKSALAGQVALHVGEHQGPVVFVSMELSKVDLAVRLVSLLTNQHSHGAAGHRYAQLGRGTAGPRGPGAPRALAAAHRLWRGLHQRRRAR
jgi:replicative DNA helicase